MLRLVKGTITLTGLHTDFLSKPETYKPSMLFEETYVL